MVHLINSLLFACGIQWRERERELIGMLADPHLTLNWVPTIISTYQCCFWDASGCA